MLLDFEKHDMGAEKLKLADDIEALEQREEEYKALWEKTDYSDCYGGYFGEKNVTCQSCDFKEMCIQKSATCCKWKKTNYNTWRAGCNQGGGCTDKPKECPWCGKKIKGA